MFIVHQVRLWTPILLPVGEHGGGLVSACSFFELDFFLSDLLHHCPQNTRTLGANHSIKARVAADICSKQARGRQIALI